MAPRSVPYMPALQLVHTRLAFIAPSVEYVPGSHAAHDVAPDDEDVPLGHTLQGVAELESWSKVPTLHGKHVVGPDVNVDVATFT